MSFPCSDSSDVEDDNLPLAQQPLAGYQPLNITGIGIDPTVLTELSQDPIEETQTQTQKDDTVEATPSVVDKENEVVVLTKVSKSKHAKKNYVDVSKMKKWPHNPNLIQHYPSLVKKLLVSVDDADAQHEVLARNTVNIKDNEWANLHFIVFGGDGGSLAGLLPKLQKATDLKKKVVDIWKFCEDNSNDLTLDPVMVSMAKRQYSEFLDTEKKDREGRESILCCSSSAASWKSSVGYLEDWVTDQ